MKNLQFSISISTLLFFFLLISLFSHIAVPMRDVEALISLKSSIDPFNLLQWRGNNACKWQGVKECMRGRVTKLVLEHLDLTGSLRETSLNQLDQLCVLSFKDNSFSGQIPNLTALVNVKSLYRNHNNFSGEFPTYISLFHRLKIIVLSHNQISGRIPNSLLNLRRLYVLDLQDNQFTGEIPPLNQSTLIYLNLSNNHLSGEIPVTLALIRFNSSSFSGDINLCGEQINRQCKKNTAISPSYNGKLSKNHPKQNAVSGHYISFGSTAPIPTKKRKARILEETVTEEKALLQGR